MRNLTDMLTAGDEATTTLAHFARHQALKVGVAVAQGDKSHRADFEIAREICAGVRHAYGFKKTHSPILTAPDENLKLGKGTTPSYGITLQHYVVKTKAAGTINLCPNAGDCTKVCVLDGGSGAYETVQRARRWKTELLATSPWSFFVLLGYELQRAVMKHGEILVRPNVNSDLQWERICPALVDGSVFGNAIKFYGYTKLTEYLDGSGWVTPHYRVAYSWNENSDMSKVKAFLLNGGSVAVVTDRKVAIGFREAQRFDARAVAAFFGINLASCFTVRDADLSDEWIFGSYVIGDLAAKGKAMALVGKSNFIVNAYNTTTEGNPS